MKYTVLYQLPDSNFWERYTQLWRNSPERSPFQSPHILQQFTQQVKNDVAIFECSLDGAMIGAAFFRYSKGVYVFLSDFKTDANFFVLHSSCTQEMTQQFFGLFFQMVRREKWSMMLNSQPAWAPYMDIFEAEARRGRVYWMNLDYAVCPVAEAETPAELFKKVGSSRNTRYKVNKFAKQGETSCEVLTDDSDIDKWVEEFSEAHVVRWATTPTPSFYRNEANRALLGAYLRAWHEDGVLVRFALMVDGRRIGCVIGLLERDSLIYHAPTFHPDFSHCSPGRVLIYYMTQWMAEHNLRILDFGYGNEDYKYHVATKEHVLKRIFISGKYNLPFILKTRFIKAIRENPRMYQVYQNKVRPIYRNMKGSVSTFMARLFSVKWLNTILLDEQIADTLLILQTI